jgi:CubicO group peptidase (beta-lactamase class C family)
MRRRPAIGALIARALSASAALVAFMPVLAAGAWAPAKKLDAYLDTLEKSQLVSGTLAVTEKGAPRYQRSIGFATIENGKPQPADAGTRYRAGPVSMLITAVLVMQRVETAGITLDTPLAEFFPDLPNALGISYRDLLAHRSGLADYTAAPGYETWRTQPRTQAQMLATIAAGGARFAPRERVEFNDSNYLLLGYMLEKVQGHSYDDLVRRHIAGKLGLSRTYFAGTTSSTLESLPYRHTSAGWVAQLQSDPSVAGGARGVMTTPADLTRVMDSLIAGTLVSAQSLASMRDQSGGSGLGLWPYQVAGQAGFGQAGDTDGFAAVYHFPSRGVSIAWMSNASALPAKGILDEFLESIFVRGHQPPTAIALTPAR